MDRSIAQLLASIALLTLSYQADASQNCGSASSGWLPWPWAEYIGRSFQQRDHCGRSRSAVGEKDHPYWINGQYLPVTSSVCKNSLFNQTMLYPNGYSHTRPNWGTSLGTQWNPAANTVCSSDTLTQTSNCGFTRQISGSKSCCAADSWSPPRSSVDYGEPMIQVNGCGQTRSRTGTRTSGDWSPQASSICAGQSFTQSQSIGPSRESVGSLLSEDWQPLASGICQGLSFTQQRSCGPSRVAVGSKNGACILSTELADTGTLQSTDILRLNAHSDDTVVRRYQLIDTRLGVAYHPVNLRSLSDQPAPLFMRTANEFSSALLALASGSYANSPPRANDRAEFCLDSDYPPSLSYSDNQARQSSCGTHSIDQTISCSFDTQGSHHPLCDECIGQPTSRTINYTNTSSSWSPAADSVCQGVSYTQTSNCGATRSAVGSRTCASCDANAWSPASNTVCDGESFTQTNECGTTRSASGTQSCATALQWEVDHSSSGAIARSTWADYKGSVLGGDNVCSAWANSFGSHVYRLWSLSTGTITNYSCGIRGETNYCYHLGFDTPPTQEPDQNCTDPSFFVCPIKRSRELTSFDIITFVCR